MITELCRYRGEGDSSYMHLRLILDKFSIIKTTPQGYWIDISHVGYIKGQISLKAKKWVSNDPSPDAKKFAFETEDRAIANFLARKDKQIRILKQQKSQAKAEREMMIKLVQDRKLDLANAFSSRLKRKYHGVVV